MEGDARFDHKKSTGYVKGVLAVLALVLVGQVTDEPAARVTFVAPDRCGDPDAFFDAIRARMPSARLDAERPTIEVVVETSSSAYDGRLTVIDDGHVFAPRRVSGADCDEVTSALALITAMILRAPPVPPPKPAGPIHTATAAATLAPSPADRLRSWRLAVAAGVAVDAGVLPRAAAHVPVAIAAGAVDAGADGIVVRAAFSWGFAGTPDDRADFSMFGLAFDVCPYTFATDTLRFEPCAALDVAALSARGGAVPAARRATRPFAAGGARFRAVWFPYGSTFLSVAGSVRAAFVRDSFATAAPEVLLHRPDPMAVGLRIGAGVVFW